MVAYLVETYNRLNWSMTPIRRNSLYVRVALYKIIMAFDEPYTVGGRLELVDETITFWTNGHRVGSVTLDDPQSLDKIDNFIKSRKLRIWDRVARQD